MRCCARKIIINLDDLMVPEYATDGLIKMVESNSVVLQLAGLYLKKKIKDSLGTHFSQNKKRILKNSVSLELQYDSKIIIKIYERDVVHLS